MPLKDGGSEAAEEVFRDARELLIRNGFKPQEAHKKLDDERSYTRKEVFPHSHPGSRLRGLRTREDMTQKELAEKIGVSPHHISEMEYGKRPIGKEMAKRLVEVLGGDYRVLL